MYLCIDIGATKTLIATMTSRGSIIKKIRFATIRSQRSFIATLTQEIQTKLDMSKITIISVAIPGPVENNRVLWLGNLPWTDFNIAKELEDTFGIPVLLQNDGNLGGYYEAKKLPGLSVYLTFSTGIGGGIMRDGEMDETLSNYEPGHNQYEWAGKVMEWEDFASAKAISELFGHPVTEIKGKVAWYEVAHRMSVGLGSIIASVRPDHIIIGGPLGLVFDNYISYLRHELQTNLAREVKMPKFLRAKRPMESVLYGCYTYARDKSNKK
jgi:predicted NBD/HSP70 family sugar kinase